MCFFILQNSSIRSKVSLDGSILMNLQSSSFSILFCLSILLLISLVQWPHSSTSIASLYFGTYKSILYPKTLC